MMYYSSEKDPSSEKGEENIHRANSKSESFLSRIKRAADAYKVLGEKALFSLKGGF
jgi:hypothetical protein